MCLCGLLDAIDVGYNNGVLSGPLQVHRLRSSGPDLSVLLRQLPVYLGGVIPKPNWLIGRRDTPPGLAMPSPF